MAVFIRFYKPYLTLSQFTDKKTSSQDKRSTLADFLSVKNVYPIGRLDYDSEGLLLLTDDGKIQHRIAHPSKKMAKTYWVQVEGDPDDKALEQLRQGVLLKDGWTRPAKLTRLAQSVEVAPRFPPIRFRAKIPTTWLEIVLHEGRNRQIRRMTAHIGHPTLRLIRKQIGPWTLAGLEPGQWDLKHCQLTQKGEIEFRCE